MEEVTIGGSARRVGEFSAFKAFYAMELVTSIETVWRRCLSAAATFKREYEEENVTTIDRAEARRLFAPRQAVETVPVTDDAGEIRTAGDEIVFERKPLFDDQGRPIMGPDPLGHLTDADWSANGQKLRVPDSPPARLLQAVMAKTAFSEGRVEILRLLALTLVPNGDLERWERDDAAQIDARLDEEARQLVHGAALDELLELAAVTVRVAKDQLRDPFDSIRTELNNLRAKETSSSPAPAATPMRIEDEGAPDTPDAENGSSSSQDASTGDPSTSGTESRSGSATSYAPA